MGSGEYPTLGDWEGDGEAYIVWDMHCTDDGMYFVLRPSNDGKLCGGTGFNGLGCTLAESLYNIWTGAWPGVKVKVQK